MNVAKQKIVQKIDIHNYLPPRMNYRQGNVNFLDVNSYMGLNNNSRMWASTEKNFALLLLVLIFLS